MYKTNNRTKIKEFLMENRARTVTVGDIVNHLNSQDNPVNKTTIYRYLDRLESDGEVIKYRDEAGKSATYQIVDAESHCEDHLHLKCVQCGQMIHLDCDFMDEIASHIEADHGFAIQCKNSVIYGVCNGCMRRGKTAPPHRHKHTHP